MDAASPLRLSVPDRGILTAELRSLFEQLQPVIHYLLERVDVELLNGIVLSQFRQAMDDCGGFSGGCIHFRQVIRLSGQNVTTPAGLGVGERNEQILDRHLYFPGVVHHADELAIVRAPPERGGPKSRIGIAAIHTNTGFVRRYATFFMLPP